MQASQVDLSQRIVAEFREMPGTCLTVDQAARLWAYRLRLRSGS